MMKDIKVVMNGKDETYIDLTTSVEGKDASRQQCLINLATIQGTDPLYEDRGTELIPGTLSGLTIDNNEMIHVANFAATDTIYFIPAHKYCEEEDNYVAEPTDIDALTLTISDYDAIGSVAGIEVVIAFNDETVETETVALNITGNMLD